MAILKGHKMVPGLDPGCIIAYLSLYMQLVYYYNPAQHMYLSPVFGGLENEVIDLLVMQGDDLRLFSSLFLVHVGSLYGGVHVPHVTRIYLVVLSQHLEHLTMEGGVCGYVCYTTIK